MAEQAETAAHWDGAYAQSDGTRSWFEEHPDVSLRMLDSAGVSAADALVDVGGGTSPLTGALLDRGFCDLTVLDISAAGMQHARGGQQRFDALPDGHFRQAAALAAMRSCASIRLRMRTRRNGPDSREFAAIGPFPRVWQVLGSNQPT